MRAEDPWFEYWGSDADPGHTISVIEDGLQQPAGFVHLKETKVNPSPKELADLRSATAVAEVLPELTNQIESMKHTVETNVYAAIRKGALTPEAALSYWMEMYAYNRLGVRMNDMAAPAAQVTTTTRR